MTYENPYGENPDPSKEHLERKETERIYFERIKKIKSKKSSEMFRIIKETYLEKDKQ
jgi:hypothetical protein